MDNKLKKTITNLIFPLLITIVILYIFLKDISLNDIKKSFLNIPLFYILVFIFLSVAGTILRAIKYNILLSKKLSFKDIFLITLVRNFSVDLLPARSAALIFYSYLTKKKGLSIDEGVSSFFVSMFYDVFALSFMLSILIFTYGTEMTQPSIYFGIALLFIISTLVVFFSDRVIKFFLKIKILKKSKKLKNFFINVYEYLINHKKNSERLVLFLLSFLIRIIKYVSLYILFEGIVQIGVSLKYFSQFSFGLAGTELSSLLPIQGVGGFGTWEVTFSFIFKMLKIPAKDPFLTGLVIHVITQAWEYLIGLLAFLFIFIQRPTNLGKDSKINSKTNH